MHNHPDEAKVFLAWAAYHCCLFGCKVEVMLRGPKILRVTLRVAADSRNCITIKHHQTIASIHMIHISTFFKTYFKGCPRPPLIVGALMFCASKVEPKIIVSWDGLTIWGFSELKKDQACFAFTGVGPPRGIAVPIAVPHAFININQIKPTDFIVHVFQGQSHRGLWPTCFTTWFLKPWC